MSLPQAEVESLGTAPPGAGPERAAPPSGLWSDAWRRLVRNRSAMTGAAIVGLFAVLAVLAPLLAPERPGPTTNLERLGGRCCPGPSAAHWFGVDDLGRDELSRVLFGARTSLLIAVVSVSVGLLLGLVLGALAGYLGGGVDAVVMRLIDIMLAFPSFLFAIGLVAVLGPGLVQIMIAIGVVSVPIFARLLRGSILSVRESEYVQAARSLGLPSRRILLVHVIPNAISPVIVAATLAMATAIVEAAGLGFLGLGNPDPSVPEWGVMLANTPRFLQSAPHLALFPGVAIVATVLGFNLLGDGLREAIDPKLRR